MYRQIRNSVLGMSGIVLIVSSLLLAAFATPLLDTQEAKAMDGGGQAVWYDHWTIRYTDPLFHYTTTYKEDADSIALEKDIDKNNTPITDSDTIQFTSVESYGHYTDRAPLDTDICQVGQDNPDAPVAYIQTHLLGQYLGSTTGSLSTTGRWWTPIICRPDGPVDVAIPRRPPDPSKANSYSSYLTWKLPGELVYHMSSNSPPVAIYGLHDGALFGQIGYTDDTNTATFDEADAPTAGSQAAAQACKDQKIYNQLRVTPYKGYQDYPKEATQFTQQYAELFVAQPGGGGCSLEDSGFFIKIQGHPDDTLPTDFDKDFTASWETGTTIRLKSGDNDLQLRAWLLEDSKNAGAGVLFTKKPPLIDFNLGMVLTAPDKCASNDSNITVEPYLLADFAKVTIYDNYCHAHTFSIHLSNHNPDYDGLLNNTPGNIKLPDCPIDASSGLNWLLCPLWQLGVTAANALNSAIQNLLYIDTDSIFDPSAGFQAGFNIFRNIGLSLLIVAGLVMVVSQAAGFEMFAAYTVRKALPRIVAAAIGMALAWPLLQAAIIFSNDLGTWVGGIILSVVPSAASGQAVETVGTIGKQAIAGYLATGAIVAILGALGLLSFVVTFVIALLIGLIVLVARQLVVITCIILAPLAIAAAVLPGTEKVWKIWRDTLIGALAMFPLIMAFISSGAALSSIANVQAHNIRASGSTDGTDLRWDVLALAAYLIPFLALPAVLGMVTGFMQAIINGTQGLFKGVLEGQKKFRSEQVAKNMQALKAGSRYASGGNIVQRAFRTLSTAGLAPLTNVVGAQAGAGLRVRGRRAQIATNRLLTPEAAAKLNSNFAAHMEDKDFLNAMVGRPASAAGQAKAALVPKTAQFRAAAFTKLGKIGQFDGDGADAERVARNIGGGNDVVSQTLLNDFQEASRSAGRLDQGNRSLQASIAGMRPEDLNGLKGAAIRRIFTPQRAGGEAPIAEMIRTGNYVDNNGRTQRLSDGQRTMLGRVYYEASYSGRVAGGDQGAVRDSYAAARRDPTANLWIGRGERAARQSKIGY